MKLSKTFFWLTGVFWLGVGYYWVRCPHDATSVPGPANGARSAQAAPVLPGGRLPVLSALDVAQHRHVKDCWIILNGVVYDASNYLDEHPGKKREIDTYCGKDGTKAWDVKPSGLEKGEPHSVKAYQALAELPRLGIVKR